MADHHMWCNKILVAYDGSVASKRALDMVLGIIKPSVDIDLVFVHVARLAASGSLAAGLDTVIADDAEAVRQELADLADGIPNNADVKVLVGTSPADLIVRCAQEEGCDLIVMGSRGQGGVKGYLGSVSYAVVKESPIAVLIAKEDD